jgi:UDP-N-acetylmuramyl pentapeptide phosphotransferase/UDP-N-acetylglucosamine-1-phosphate transferase
MYPIYLLKKMIIAIDQSYKTYKNQKVSQIVNINKIYPESANAHKWLDGLDGIEIGPSLVNSFGIKSKTLGLQFDVEKSYEQKNSTLIIFFIYLYN